MLSSTSEFYLEDLRRIRHRKCYLLCKTKTISMFTQRGTCRYIDMHGLCDSHNHRRGGGRWGPWEGQLSRFTVFPTKDIVYRLCNFIFFFSKWNNWLTAGCLSWCLSDHSSSYVGLDSWYSRAGLHSSHWCFGKGADNLSVFSVDPYISLLKNYFPEIGNASSEINLPCWYPFDIRMAVLRKIV